MAAVVVTATLASWAAPAAAEPAAERLIRQIVGLRPDLAAAAEMAAARCAGAEPLCLALDLRRTIPGEIRLQRREHPDTDTIRWAKTSPSLTFEPESDPPVIRLDRFGRKVLSELEAVLGEIGTSPVIIDLANNRGGDFGRMLQVAGRLGSTAQIVETSYGGRAIRSEPVPASGAPVAIDSVRIGPATASAGRLLADLLDAGGVPLEGESTARGSVTRKAVLTVDHDWRLVLATGEMRAARAETRLPPERIGGLLVALPTSVLED